MAKQYKKLTRDQKKLLERNKKDPDNYLFITSKLVHADEDYKSRNRQSLNQSSKKVKKLFFYNTETNETEEIIEE